MRHRRLAQLIPLALALAFAPVQAAVAASPLTQDEATVEDTHWLAAVSASRLVGNSTSLTGRIQGSERRGRLAGNGTSLSGRKLNADGGMTVVSIEIPGGARHAK